MRCTVNYCNDMLHCSINRIKHIRMQEYESTSAFFISKICVTTFFVIFYKNVLTTLFVNVILCLTRKVVKLQTKDVKVQKITVKSIL